MDRSAANGVSLNKKCIFENIFIDKILLSLRSDNSDFNHDENHKTYRFHALFPDDGLGR